MQVFFEIMLIVFIIIQLTFKVLWLRSYSIELMTNSFLTFKPCYNNKQPILLEAQLFTGGPAPRPPGWLRPCGFVNIDLIKSLLDKTIFEYFIDFYKYSSKISYIEYFVNFWKIFVQIWEANFLQNFSNL